MSLRTLLLTCVLLGTSIVESARIQHQAKLDANTTAEDAGAFSCANYCVMCNDGTTVWYGRSKSWFRSFVNLFLSGAIIPITGVVNMYFKATKEEFTHWTGYMPTTGLFCEKVDVVKFPVEDPRWEAFQPLMLYDRNWFGKLTYNELKPYTPAGYSVLKPWATGADAQAYIDGCKVVKAAGASGSAAQFAANFQSFCANHVTEGVFKCSEHSRLCGAVGVHSVTYADTFQQCRDQKGHVESAVQCKAPNAPPAQHIVEEVHVPVAPGYMQDSTFPY